MAKIEADNPFRCSIGCTCGAEADEGCEFKVEWFEDSCSVLLSWLRVLRKLDLVVTENMLFPDQVIHGYEYHDVLEPIMAEKFK